MRHRPIRNNYPRGSFGEIDYQERLERYCTYLENLKNSKNITDSELKLKSKKEFFEEFMYDAEFRSIFNAMLQGTTSYQVIEYLIKSKKELLESLQKAVENTPTKIILTTEEFNKIKKNK